MNILNAIGSGLRNVGQGIGTGALAAGKGLADYLNAQAMRQSGLTPEQLQQNPGLARSAMGNWLGSIGQGMQTGDYTGSRLGYQQEMLTKLQNLQAMKQREAMRQSAAQTDWRSPESVSRFMAANPEAIGMAKDAAQAMGSLPMPEAPKPPKALGPPQRVADENGNPMAVTYFDDGNFKAQPIKLPPETEHVNNGQEVIYFDKLTGKEIARLPVFADPNTLVNAQVNMAGQKNTADIAAADRKSREDRYAEERKIDLQRLGIDSATLGLRMREFALKTGGSLGALSPQQRSVAEKIASGDMNPTMLSRYPDKEAIMAGALEINPDWSSNTYATKKAFTDPAGKQSQNLGTISRIVGHIGSFEKNSTDLGTSASLLFGTSLTGPAAKVQEDAHAISSELEKLVSGGVGTLSQVNAWTKGLLSSRPGIRQAAIDEISMLMGSQFEGMNQTYKAGTGLNLPLDQFATPESKKWLEKHGINVSGSQPAPAPSPSQSYKQTATGPNGHKIGSNDGVHWFDLSTGKEVQ